MSEKPRELQKLGQKSCSKKQHRDSCWWYSWVRRCKSFGSSSFPRFGFDVGGLCCSGSTLLGLLFHRCVGWFSSPRLWAFFSFSCVAPCCSVIFSLQWILLEKKIKNQKGRRTQKGALGYLGGGLNLSIVSCQLSRYDYITSSIISYRMKGLKMILRTKYNNEIERLKSQSGARGDPNTMSVNEWDQIHVCKKPNVWSRQSRWSRWGLQAIISISAHPESDSQ